MSVTVSVLVGRDLLSESDCTSGARGTSGFLHCVPYWWHWSSFAAPWKWAPSWQSIFGCDAWLIIDIDSHLLWLTAWSWSLMHSLSLTWLWLMSQTQADDGGLMMIMMNDDNDSMTQWQWLTIDNDYSVMDDWNWLCCVTAVSFDFFDLICFAFWYWILNWISNQITSTYTDTYKLILILEFWIISLNWMNFNHECNIIIYHQWSMISVSDCSWYGFMIA